MKKTLSLLMAMLALIGVARAQSVLPEFSAEDSPVWYYVTFSNGGNVLADQGSGKNIKTAAKAASDAQQWMLIGTKDDFVMKSKNGNYVNFASSRFTTSSTGTALKLVESTNATYAGAWEIQRKNSSSSMNMWGGAGAGKEIGEYNLGDSGNALTFTATSMKLPEFSDENSTTWYFIKFSRTGNTLADQGPGEKLRTASADPVDGQLWKLQGTQDAFQLVSKSGHYAAISGTGDNARIVASATPSAENYNLHSTANATYAPGWEIHVNGRASRPAFNQWSDVKIGQEIGLWEADDVNNVFTLVKPEEMTYSDFKTVGITGYAPQNKLTLWYDEPATTAPLYSGGQGYSAWMEYALPLGNGQLGASIFGGVAKDEIQFNEKTLWSGRSTDNSSEYGDYENFGSVYAEEIGNVFGYASTTAAQDYYRQLDLTNATASVSYKSPDKSVTYTREYIVSNPDNVVAAIYKASAPGSINLRFTLVSGKPGVNAATSYSDGGASFSGKLETVSYNARLKVIPTGGQMVTGEDGITVTGADQVLVVLSGATDFDPYSTTYVSNTAGLAATVQGRVDAAAGKTWDELYAAHVTDHKTYFDRVDFDLEGTQNTLPTNELVDTYNNGAGANARMLEQLYFAYGRYLEIGSSRGVDLPSNLQGIWNNMSEPAWNSDIHSNINVQMNYWPAEQTNLSEMHVPFLNYIVNMAVNHNEWKNYAKAANQNRGWTCYTENNIFGGVGSFMHNYVIANAWYCTHLWQHYRYTLDKEYLKKVFPAMLSASQFWLDRLVLANDGTYECPNEYSPEHGPASENGVAHAQQLVYDLLSNTQSAIEVLGSDANVSESDVELLNDRLSKLDNGLHTETYTGNWGTDRIPSSTPILREWKYSPYTATTEGRDHRHMSHLMCLYPFSQVLPGTELFDAAVNSLKLRGDGATGWSMGWKINLWARAQDGDHAHAILQNALAHSAGGAGVFYNLFDAHAPFQIDGNFGACAGMAEMLMQSQTDTIQVLPALPSAWPAGNVKGLKAIGDFTVDIAWKEGKPTRVTIVNHQGQACPVKYAGISGIRAFVNGVQTSLTAINDNAVYASPEKGAVTVFDFDNSYEPTGISQAQASELDVKVTGRTVALGNADVKSVDVYDLSGRNILTTTKSTFEVDPTCGDVIILKTTDQKGNTNVHKLALGK